MDHQSHPVAFTIDLSSIYFFARMLRLRPGYGIEILNSTGHWCICDRTFTTYDEARAGMVTMAEIRLREAARAVADDKRRLEAINGAQRA
jgi:hypothetical protein